MTRFVPLYFLAAFRAGRVGVDVLLVAMALSPLRGVTATLFGRTGLVTVEESELAMEEAERVAAGELVMLPLDPLVDMVRFTGFFVLLLCDLLVGVGVDSCSAFWRVSDTLVAGFPVAVDGTDLDAERVGPFSVLSLEGVFGFSKDFRVVREGAEAAAGLGLS